MTMVPWAVLEPGQTETIAAVMLGREHPHSVHLRPARGDGGIDVLNPVDDGQVDVYQVKYFTGSLTDDRKEQIRRSVRRILGNHAIRLRRWYLVVPLNPSQDERDWLNSYLREREIDGEWFGLHRLEGLAAAHQDVVDYYVGAGRDRLMESLSILRQAVGLQPTEGDQLLRPEDTVQQLTALYQALDRDDPLFRYELEVGATPPDVGPLLTRPGLLASVTVGLGDTYVTHHVHPKFDAAQSYRENPLTFTVHQDRMDVPTAVAWERALKYGTAVQLPVGVVTDFTVDLPGGLASNSPDGALSLWATWTPTAQPYFLRGRLVDESDRLLAEVFLDMQPVTVGMFREGVRAHGQERGGAFDIEILMDLAPDGTVKGAKLNLSLNELEGKQPAALRGGTRFLAALGYPHRLEFAPEFGPPAGNGLPVTAAEPMVTTEFVDLIEALADLQENVKADLRVPRLSSLTTTDYQEIVRAGRLARGETVSDSWAGQEFTMPLFDSATEVHGPVRLALAGHVDVLVGEQTVRLKPVTNIFLAAELTFSDGSVTATPALGNTTILTRMASIDAFDPDTAGS